MGEAATRGPRRQTGQVMAAAAILLALLGTFVGLALRPGGTIVGDVTTTVRETDIIGPITTDQAFTQPFVASQHDLAAIDITFGTFGGASRCDLLVELLDDGTPVASQEWSCAALPDSSAVRALEFEPIPDSGGRLFEVAISRADDVSGDVGAPIVWGGALEEEEQPALLGDDVVEGITAAVRPQYDPEAHVADHLATMYSRMEDYGAPWATREVWLATLMATVLLLAAGPLVARSPRSILLVVCGLALLRGLVWTALVPPFQGMDEPAHFSNAEYIAETGYLPNTGDHGTDYSDRLWQASDLMNVDATVPGARPEYTEMAVTEAEDLSRLPDDNGGSGPAASYGPLYYMGAAAFYRLAPADILSQLGFARLFSVSLGVLTAGMLVVIALRLFPGSRAAQLAFGVAGVFQPMMAHQFAIVNNDAWVITLGVALLAIGLTLATRRHAAGLAFLAGCIVGLAVQGKPFGIAAIVPMAAGWLIGKVRTGERSARVWFREALLVVAGLMVTYGTWTALARLWGIEAQSVPETNGVDASLREFIAAQVGPALSQLKLMWGSQLWGNFGWVRIPLPRVVTDAIFFGEALLVLLVLVWLLAITILAVSRRARSWSGTRRDEPTDEGVASELLSASTRALPIDARLGVVSAAILAMVFTLYAAAAVYYLSSGANDLLQGRYALMAAPAMIALPALLVERVTKRESLAAAVMVAVAIAVVLVSILSIFIVQEAFYG